MINRVSSSILLLGLLLFEVHHSYRHSGGLRSFRTKSKLARQHIRLSAKGDPSQNTNNEDEIDKAFWMPKAVTKALSSISLPNVLAGSFLGAALVLFGLFGPLFFGDVGDLLPDGSVVISQDQSSDGAANKPSSSSSGKSSKEAMTKAITLFSDVLTTLRNGYVDEVDQNRLFETAINAMLKSLDPYTEFENMKQAKSIQESVQGRYGGVGLVIANQQEKTAGGKAKAPTAASATTTTTNAGRGNIVVVDAFEGYSYESGMRVGDRLLSVGGTDVSNLQIDDVRDLLRGVPDTDVVVKYERDGVVGDQEAVLHRRAIRLSDVRLATFLGDPKDRIGYISLSGFNAGAAKDFRTAYLVLKYSAMMQQEGLITPDGKVTQKALDQVQVVRDTVQAGSPAASGEDAVSSSVVGRRDHDDDGPGLNGLVLDLRGNPGGLLDAAVEIASYLVPPQSDIVSAKSRNGPSIVYKSSVDPIRDPRTKLVVLVNRGSASASEIVSGAVQDLDAGVIVGESRTYGKGLVQKIVPLPYDSALKYTIAKYYTPSGRCIQAVNYAGGRGDEQALQDAERSLEEVEAGVDGLSGGGGVGGILKPSEDGDEGSFLLRSPGALQDKLDGASFVRDKDRKTYFTSNGRPVKDAGGIEPDIVVSENELTPTEKIFVTKDVYNGFAKEYLRQHRGIMESQVRPSVEEERNSRDNDARYPGRRTPEGASIGRWLVLQTPDNGPIRSFQKSENRVAFGKTTHDQLYSDFKKYVTAQVRDNKLELDGVGLEKSIGRLEASLKANGLDEQGLGLTRDLRNRISQGILSNMDSVKENIADGLEVTLLSRELPDRLLIWRAVTDDQQVLEAAKILKNDPRGGIRTATTTTAAAANVPAAPTQQVAQAGKKASASEFGKTYETALQPPPLSLSSSSRGSSGENK